MHRMYKQKLCRARGNLATVCDYCMPMMLRRSLYTRLCFASCIQLHDNTLLRRTPHRYLRPHHIIIRFAAHHRACKPKHHCIESHHSSFRLHGNSSSTHRRSHHTSHPLLMHTAGFRWMSNPHPHSFVLSSYADPNVLYLDLRSSAKGSSLATHSSCTCRSCM